VEEAGGEAFWVEADGSLEAVGEEEAGP